MCACDEPRDDITKEKKKKEELMTVKIKAHGKSLKKVLQWNTEHTTMKVGNIKQQHTTAKKKCHK